MKKSKINFLRGCLLFTFTWGSVFGVTPTEKSHAHQRIVALKNQIQAERSAHELALQADLSEKEKTELTVKYTENRKRLFQHVREQRDIISGMTPTKRLLWDVAKIGGTIALLSLAVYNFFSTPPTKVGVVQFPLKEVDKSIIHDQGLTEGLKQEIPVDSDVSLLSPKDELTQLPVLPREQYEKNRDASLVFGKVGSMLTFLSMGIPVLLPFAIAIDLSAIYYGIKTLNLKSMVFKPIVFDEITIIPEDMPY